MYGVPAHTSVEDNEMADLIAKNVLKLKDEKIRKVPFGKGEARSLVNIAVRESWQKKWDTDNKRRTILYKI